MSDGLIGTCVAVSLVVHSRLDMYIEELYML